MDDDTKARQFIYYLRAGSDADEWFEDLPEKEKGSWVEIEMLFRRKWLKEEEISIKESFTSKNEPLPKSTPSPSLDRDCLVPATPPDHTTSFTTQIETTASQKLEIGYSTTCLAIPQSPAAFENGENIKSRPTSEISPFFAVFSSPVPSSISPELTTPSTTSTALETPSTMAIFAQKHENSPNISPTTPKTPTPIIAEPTDDITRVYASPPSINDDVLRHSTFPVTSSSPDSPQLPHLGKPKWNF
jgi:hypothetical protein